MFGGGSTFASPAAQPTTGAITPFGAKPPPSSTSNGGGGDGDVREVAYDAYGKRMATCATDRYIRIWDRVHKNVAATGEDNNSNKRKESDWKLVAEWDPSQQQQKVQQQAVAAFKITKLNWAHPEFGNVLAVSTISANANGSTGQVQIWQQDESSSIYGDVSSSSVWTCKAMLPTTTSLGSFEFAPRHLGLKLAITNAEANGSGIVQIYEAMDVMDLSKWSLIGKISPYRFADNSAGGNAVPCLAWSQGRYDPPTLAIGGVGKVGVHRYDETKRRWTEAFNVPTTSSNAVVQDISWAPSVGGSTQHIACAEGRCIQIIQIASATVQPQGTQTLDVPSDCSRCEFNVTGKLLVAGCDDGTLQVFELDFDDTFKYLSETQQA